MYKLLVNFPQTILNLYVFMASMVTFELEIPSATCLFTAHALRVYAYVRTSDFVLCFCVVFVFVLFITFLFWLVDVHSFLFTV